MALLTDAVTGAGLVLQLASEIQTIGANFYKATAEWEEFPDKVDLLQQKVKFWEGQIAKYGMKSDQTLVKAVDGAKAELEKEKEKLTKRQSSGGNSGRWCFTVRMLTFPSQLGSSLKRVIDKFDEVDKTITEEDEKETALQKRAFGRCFSVPIRKDNRYVPMKATEAAVSKALENAAGPAVVLLHGGPGRGKTSVAYSMALRYKGTHPFEDGVYFIKCGPSTNFLEKQSDLLQMCHPESANLLFQQAGPQREIWIQGRLQSLLKDTKRLIILDDVFDSDLLQSIVGFCGFNVKCLVTSQSGDLCRIMDEESSVTIKIEDVRVEHGRQIMASHVGFPNDEMPNHLKGYCDELILASNCHPLAITTIANEIPKNRRNDANEWKTALTDISHLLQSEKKAAMHGQNYPKTFWATMKLSMESLSPEAKKVLILTQAIKAPSIHEEVMKLMYHSNFFGKNNKSFSKVRSELEDKDLLRIESVFYAWSSSTGPDDGMGDSSMYWMWTLHSLRKRFIIEEMDVEWFFDSLEMESHFILADDHSYVDVENNTDEVAVMAICAIFFEEPFATRFASKLHVPCGILKGRLKSTLSLILRMSCPINMENDQIAKKAAMKVLANYTCNEILDEKATMTLLTMPHLTISDMPKLILFILSDMIRNVYITFSHSWSPLWEKAAKGVLKALGGFLQAENTPIVKL